MKGLLTLIILLLSALTNSFGQEVFLEEQLLLDSLSPNEPAIAVDKKNPQRIVVFAAVGHLFTSLDGGINWNYSKLDHEYGVWSDPSVFFDKQGTAYIFHLSGTKKGISSDRIICLRSNDLKNWEIVSTPAFNPKTCQERPIAVYNNYKDEIYLTYVAFDAYGSVNKGDSTRLYFTKSIDKGKTWSEPIRINHQAGDCSDKDMSVQGGGCAFSEKGDLMVTWAFSNKMWASFSSDGGQHWSEKEIGQQSGGWDYEVPGIEMPNGLPATVCLHNKWFAFWTKAATENPDNSLIFSSLGKKQERLNLPLSKGVGKCFHPAAATDQESKLLVCMYYKQTEAQSRATGIFASVSTNYGNSFKEIKLNNKDFYPIQSEYLGDRSTCVMINKVLYTAWITSENKIQKMWFKAIDLSSVFVEK